MSGKLTSEQVRKCVQEIYFEGYNDGYANRGCHLEETDWRTITDKLNAVISEDEKLLDLAQHAWDIAVCAMNGVPIPAYWGNAVEKGLKEYGVNVSKLPYII